MQQCHILEERFHLNVRGQEQFEREMCFLQYIIKRPILEIGPVRHKKSVSVY